MYSQYFTIPTTSYLQPNSSPVINMSSNWKYRQYMQTNATQIMKYNAHDSMNASGNNPYMSLNNNNPNANVPHLFTSLHDTRMPNYGVNNSDLKQSFMKKQQFNAVLLSPSIPTDKF